MILFAIMFMLAVTCKYIQCTDLACHARFQENLVGKECCPSLDRVHIGVPMLWSSTTTWFRCSVVVMIEAPFMSTK